MSFVVWALFDELTAAISDERGWAERLPPEYAIPERAPSLAEAQEYCRRLARSHYENFSVATWFLPERLRQHFFNVYAYCRISDDLGDEVGDPRHRSRCSISGRRSWMPAMPATRGIPCLWHWRRRCGRLTFRNSRLRDLLKAFRQDQTVTRYETFNDLLGYCRLLGESGGTSRALSLRISRCGASGAFRFHLHRAAIGEFLAGRERGLRQGTNLSSAGRPAKLWSEGGRYCDGQEYCRHFAR